MNAYLAKTAPTQENQNTGLSGAQRVILLLLSMEEAKAAAVLNELSPEDIMKISREVASMPSATLSELQAAAERFETICLETPSFLTTTTAILSKIPTELEPTNHQEHQSPASIWQEIAGVNKDVLVQYLRAQPIGFAAYILLKLKRDLSTEILGLLNPDERNSLICGMTTAPQISDRIVGITEETIRSDLLEPNGLQGGNHEAIAEILNNLDAPQTELILQNIKIRSPNDAAALKRMLFRFEDLLDLPPAVVGRVVERLPVERLVLALHGSSHELQQVVLQKMSARARRMAESELKSGIPAAPEVISEAKRFLTGAICKMISEGALTVND